MSLPVDLKYEPLLRTLQSLSSEDQANLIREWGLNDLYFFAKFILGYWWLTGPVHQEFAAEVQKDTNLSLFLLPRGHCKTQIFTIADGIRQYLKVPSEPIAIVCDALKRSVKKMRAVKWHFESNRRLRELFPDKIWANPQKESPKWTDEEFILPYHTGRQEPSFLATSLENQPTGLHFPRIKCDDIVTPETCTSREMMDKNRDAYGLMRSSILQTGGNIQIAGTIYDDGDLHCDMEKSGMYRTYKRPASYHFMTGKAVPPSSDGAVALWPEQFSLNRQEEIRKDPTVGDYIYSCQYLLDPTPEDENAFFSLNWFPRYEVIPDRLTLYAAADLAISEREKAAYTAIVVAGIDMLKRLPVVHVRRGHWDALSIIEELIDVQRTWKPLMFAIEVENIERTIGPFLKKAMQEAGVYLNLEEFRPDKDKVARARSIQGRAKQGVILLPKRGAFEPPWLADFEYELRRFPKARTKDQVDSFALIGLLLDKIVQINKDPEHRRPLSDRIIDAVTGQPGNQTERIHLTEQMRTDNYLRKVFGQMEGEGDIFDPCGGIE